MIEVEIVSQHVKTYRGIVNYEYWENRCKAEQMPESVAARIMPVASVHVKAVTAAAGSRSGEDVFKGQCSSCHAAGALGAPKYGDAAAWAPRIGQGLETLWDHAMKGKNAMPPKGGAADLTDAELKAAVEHLVGLSK